MTGWAALEAELAEWRAGGLTLPLWWRDDDAVAAHPALDQLLALSDAHAMPVHLAVIPEGLDPSLAPRLARTRAVVLVHGHAHRSHAPAGEKKAEFGAHRPLSDMQAEAAQGLARLRGEFGARCAPVFVPPWNRIAPELVPLLSGVGYAALSTFTPRRMAEAAPGLWQINTHLDPINWRGDRSLVAQDQLLDQICTHLAARRAGAADNDEPFGLLTHHLVHDRAIWDFTDRLLGVLRAGPVVLWRADTLNQRG